MAQDLVDTKLLATLREGDLITTEAKYYRSCLTRLYNAYRDPKTKESATNSAPEVIRGTFYYLIYNPLIYNISKWSDII